jgi:hypothetical protein
VAQQAAAWAGIAPEVMRQMMPTVAATLMGGLFKSAANEGLADMFEGFAKALRGGAPAAPPRRPEGRGESEAADPFGAWTNMIGAMWGVTPSGPAKAEPEPPAPDPSLNPFAPWAAMMSGALGGQPATTTPEPPKAAPPHDPFALFSGMMETGLEVQQQYVSSLQNIFDSCWGAGPDRR